MRFENYDEEKELVRSEIPSKVNHLPDFTALEIANILEKSELFPSRF